MRHSHLLPLLLLPSFLAAAPDPPVKPLPLAGEAFLIAGQSAFVIPPAESPDGPIPWVWYAPTLPGLPGDAERWMFERFTRAGIAIAGIDVGESYGSPDGRALYSALYEELTRNRGFAPKPVLLGRSRGGLMTLAWAAENADKVAGFAGVYPVCNLTSYPGVDQASGAYGMTSEQLTEHLPDHNPLDRLEALAKAGVPLFAIHGDADTVVPLEANSGEMRQRYAALGGAMQLIVPPGQGHNMWEGFFQCQELVDFVLARLKPAEGASGLAAIPAFTPGARVLFQGDSITDGNRGRNTDPNHILGHGYAFIIAARHGAAFPEASLDFMNRGISGHTVLDLEKRWQADTLDLKPDLLSILVGINDSGKGIPLDQFEQVYDKLLTDARAANPNLKLVLCEPFVLPVGKTRENDEAKRVDVGQRQEIVARLASKHGAALVKAQDAFDEACRRAPAEHWIWDGVHPTYSGHQILADAWEKAVRDFWK
jgi:lysophospholipase L1-like esterase/pimeloyl-ACP methyl ester carboxylesterase